MPEPPVPIETVRTALTAATERLRAAGVPDPRRDAERLLARLLDTDRGGLVTRSTERVSPKLAGRLDELIRRRGHREPLQHLIGVQEFHGVEIRVDRRALIPRPETEALVDAVLGFELHMGSVVVDLGTGTGCIPIALALARPDLVLRGIDRSSAALQLARANVDAHHLATRITLVEGDLAAPPEEWAGSADVVVSNPPYVSAAEWADLEPEVREHEPKVALVPGESGLEAYPVVTASARSLLRSGGRLVLEIGYGQARDVRRIVTEAGFKALEIWPDLRGIPRVVLARASKLDSTEERE
jgi:release factor glutamine methyltransferase